MMRMRMMMMMIKMMMMKVIVDGEIGVVMMLKIN